jgi:hypothetical protein
MKQPNHSVGRNCGSRYQKRCSLLARLIQDAFVVRAIQMEKGAVFYSSMCLYPGQT